MCLDLSYLALGQILTFRGVVFEHVGADSLVFNVSESSFLVAVVDVQADWPGWLLGSCQRYWQHGKYPCPCCNHTNFADINAITLSAGPWEDYTHDEWLRDVDSHKKALIVLLVGARVFLISVSGKDMREDYRG